MLSAIQTSLFGLLSASSRARLAADNIVRAGAQAANAVEAGDVASGRRAYGEAAVLRGDGTGVQPPTGAARGYGPPKNEDRAAMEPAPPLAQSMVDLKLAAQAYKANAVALRTADEMLGSLVEDKS